MSGEGHPLAIRLALAAGETGRSLKNPENPDEIN